MTARLRTAIGVLAVLIVTAGCGKSEVVQDSATDRSLSAATLVAVGDAPGGIAHGRSIPGLTMPLLRDVGSAVGPQAAPLITPGLGGLLYLGRTSRPGELTASELRLVRDGTDTLLLPGAETFAVNSNGVIAAGRPTAQGGSEVVILSEPGAPAQVLATSNAHYEIHGWAGAYLIVREQFGESGVLPVVIRMTTSGDAVVLARDAGPTSISPDGSQVLLDVVNGGDSNVSMILDVKSGKQIGTVDLSGGPQGLVLGQASWTSAGVAAAGFVDSATTSTPYAVRLAETAGGLVLTDAVALPPGLLNGLNEPYLSNDGSSIRGWSVDASVHQDANDKVSRSPYLAVACDLASATCKVVPVGEPNLQIGRIRTTSRDALTSATMKAEDA